MRLLRDAVILAIGKPLTIFLGKAAGFACDLWGQATFCMSQCVLLVTCVMVTQYLVICLLFGFPDGLTLVVSLKTGTNTSF